MASDLSARKSALRRSALARRDAVEPAVRARFAERLAHDLPGALARLGSRRIALYAPIRNEPDCSPLLAALHGAGLQTLLPAVVGGKGSPLEFRQWRPGDPLVAGRVGWTLEPPASLEAFTPDALFVPLAAFDRTGGRIGFGGGHYDATLRALRARGAPLAIGLAFSCQEIDQVPLEPHDERLDAALTESHKTICTETGKALNAAALHW